MEDEENQDDSLAPLPVLPRLDRLDRLLQLLEEKHQTSGMHSSNPVTEQYAGQCKALASALEEVHHKGTLMERLSMLENRVLQLSLDIYERNTSRSSSSTALVSEISCQDSVVVPKVSNQHEAEIVPRLEKLDPRLIQEEDCGEEGRKFVKPKRRENGTTQKKKSNRKWIGWFRMRCY